MRRPVHPSSVRAEPFAERVGALAPQLADRRHAHRVERLHAFGSDARDAADRQRIEERLHLLRLDDRDAGGFAYVAGNLRHQLVGRDAQAAGQAVAGGGDLVLHGRCERVRLGPRRLGRGVQVRLVDADLFDDVALAQCVEDPAAEGAVVRVVGGQVDGVGSAPPRRRDRHARADPVRPGLVAGGGDDAAASALVRVGADDDGAAFQLGPPLHFARREEGVHVQVDDDPVVGHRVGAVAA